MLRWPIIYMSNILKLLILLPNLIPYSKAGNYVFLCKHSTVVNGTNAVIVKPLPKYGRYVRQWALDTMGIFLRGKIY